MQQTDGRSKLIAVWMPLDEAEQFARIAKASERSVSGELRRLIRLRLEMAEQRTGWEVRDHRAA